MIILVQGIDYDTHSIILDEMFQLRAKVFADRLGWDVSVKNGIERDRFDEINPLYLLSIGGQGQLNGSLRLLPTTGPNMLSDVFSQILKDGDDVRSPLIWESSRFCVSADAGAERCDNRLNYTTGELLAGLCEVGMMAGLQSIVTVYDARIKRVVRIAGCEGIEIGTPTKFGKVTAYAGLFSTDEVMLSSIKDAAGITGSVLSGDTTMLQVAA